MSKGTSRWCCVAWSEPSPDRPNIRIVIEFADNLLAHTVNPADFVDYIRGLGFAICRVLPNFKIRLVPAGEALSGFNYCLLTRTPEEDIRVGRRAAEIPPIRFKRWLDGIR